MDMEVDSPFPFTGNGDVMGHKLLLEIDADLECKDIEDIKFFCQGSIGMAKLQKMDRGLQIFEELEQLTLIYPKEKNFSFLVEILYRIHRLDLVKKLGVDTKYVRQKYHNEGDYGHTQLLPLRILLYHIAEDMEEKEFEETVFMLSQRFGKAKMKKMKNLLEVFTYLQREEKLESDNVRLLYEILSNLQTKRTDLIDLVKEYEQYPWRRQDGNTNAGVPPPASQNNSHRHVIAHPTTGPRYLTGTNIIHIAAGLAEKPHWKNIVTQLGITDQEFQEVTCNEPVQASQIVKLLSYWKDTKNNNCEDCGQMIYMALQSAGFPDVASLLAEDNQLPGVPSFIPTDDHQYDREHSDLNLQPEVRARTPLDVRDSPTVRATHQGVGVPDPRLQQPQQSQVQRPPHTSAMEESISRGMPDIPNTTVSVVQRGTGAPPVGDVLQNRPNASEPSRMGSGQEAQQTQDPPLDEAGRQINDLVNSARTMHMDIEMDLPSYKMTVKPRGFAVIINNNKFFKEQHDPDSKEMPDRTGTERDSRRLKYIFQKLEFIVHEYDDLQDYQMAQKMSEYSAKNHNAYDCFVCCILSHGAVGHVYGVNGKLIRIDILTQFFRAQSCPSLAGKPKLFFIQACQGRTKQEGFDLEMDTNTEVAHRPPGQDLVADLQREMIPDEADFLLGYATVPGYVSYRSRSQGSWYVNKLVDMLDKYGSRYDLVSIMVKVNEEVGRSNANIEGGRYKQIPAPLVTLRKKVYFR